MSLPTESPNTVDAQIIADNVRAAIAEDVGSGDISAQLIPADALGAVVLTESITEYISLNIYVHLNQCVHYINY